MMASARQLSDPTKATTTAARSSNMENIDHNERRIRSRAETSFYIAKKLVRDVVKKMGYEIRRAQPAQSGAATQTQLGRLLSFLKIKEGNKKKMIDSLRQWPHELQFLSVLRKRSRYKYKDPEWLVRMVDNKVLREHRRFSQMPSAGRRLPVARSSGH